MRMYNHSWIYWSKNILFNRCSMFVYRHHQKPYALTLSRSLVSRKSPHGWMAVRHKIQSNYIPCGYFSASVLKSIGNDYESSWLRVCERSMVPLKIDTAAFKVCSCVRVHAIACVCTYFIILYTNKTCQFSLKCERSNCVCGSSRLQQHQHQHWIYRNWQRHIQ